MHLSAASRCLAFESTLRSVTPELEAKLRAQGVTQAAVFASLWDTGSKDAEEAESFALLLGATADELGDWARDILRLYEVATGASEEIARRQPRLTGYQVSADLITQEAAWQERREQAVNLNIRTEAHLA